MNVLKLIQLGEFLGTLLLAAWLGWKCFSSNPRKSIPIMIDHQFVTIDHLHFVSVSRDGCRNFIIYPDDTR
jgi:hypothetical protein